MAGVLRPALTDAKWTGGVTIHDFTLDKEMRLLNEVITELGLFTTSKDAADILADSSYFFAFFFLPDRSVELMGHPPQSVIRDALTLQGLPEKLVLAQEDMHSQGTTYQVWDFTGSVMSFPISTSLKQALQSSGWLPAEGAGPSK